MAKRAPKITQDELAAAIEAARADFRNVPRRPAGWFSVSEFCAETKLAPTSTRDRLRELVAAGIYERMVVIDIDAAGRKVKLPVYRKVKDAKLDRAR